MMNPADAAMDRALRIKLAELHRAFQQAAEPVISALAEIRNRYPDPIILRVEDIDPVKLEALKQRAGFYDRIDGMSDIGGGSAN